ncbi:unnamed protein product [Allacma fusca]|uniref:Uncharacterized protein n=1 Tax=Allacma fusca TaxID=39272 RepID=A0A8J2PI12_9HEXA|nr:unnamed protein product [Allacma fusca]
MSNNYIRGESIRVGENRYTYNYTLELKSGLTKEYYICDLCRTRLHVYVDLGRFELKSAHKEKKCAEAHQKFVEEFKTKHNRTPMMESIIVDSRIDNDDTFGPTFLDDSFALSALMDVSNDPMTGANTGSGSGLDTTFCQTFLDTAFLDDTMVSWSDDSSRIPDTDVDTDLDTTVSGNGSVLESVQDSPPSPVPSSSRRYKTPIRHGDMGWT